MPLRHHERGVTLTACYVVHDEAHQLAKSILSVKAYVDRFVIVDCAFTSNPVESVLSTDDTHEVAVAACEGVQLDYIMPIAKKSEDEARNLYLDNVSEGWVLLMDADETLIADHDDMTALVRDLPGVIYDALNVRVYTTSVLFNGNADEIDADRYARSPRVSTYGWMPKVVRWSPGLRHERRESLSGFADHHGIYRDGDVLLGLDIAEAVILNDHAGQGHAAYQHDFVWEMAQR